MYRCETVPSWKLDPYLQCGQSEGDVACFSLNPFIEWRCPSTRLIYYKKWWDKSHTYCTKKKDVDNNYYDGRCLMKGHADYAKAEDYPDKKLVYRRSVPTRADWNEAVPTFHQEPKYGLKIPPVSSQAIGWKPTKNWVAQGKWCGVQQPAKGWSPGVEHCKKKNAEVSVLSYNLYWWYLFDKMDGKATWMDGKGGIFHNDKGAAGKTMDAFGPFDIMGFQECNDVERVLEDANMDSFVDFYQAKNAVANAWRKDKFKNLEQGYEDVAEDLMNENWFGRRGVAWNRLQHKETGATIFFINHHGPLPDDTGGFCGGHATVYNILRVIAQRAHKGDSIILTGDFNAAAETSTTHVLDQHLSQSFQGDDFKGVDKFYHNCPKTTKVKKTANIGKGGSDHAGLVVTYEL